MPVVYLCIPIQYCKDGALIEETLDRLGITVLNPCRITPEEMATSKDSIPRAVAMKCWSMIDASSALVLYADYYGRDCAAEIGYAIAQGKPIYPYSVSGHTPFLETDWMVKSFIQEPSTDLEHIAEQLRKQHSVERQNGSHIRKQLINP